MWALIIIAINSYGGSYPHPSVSTLGGFKSLKSCHAAADTARNYGVERTRVEAFCVKQ